MVDRERYANRAKIGIRQLTCEFLEEQYQGLNKLGTHYGLSKAQVLRGVLQYALEVQQAYKNNTRLPPPHQLIQTLENSTLTQRMLVQAGAEDQRKFNGYAKNPKTRPTQK